MAMKGNCCSICGVKANEIPDSKFHFHHTIPSIKKLTVGSHRGHKQDIILEVLKPTTILCCERCHRKIHGGILDYERKTPSASSVDALTNGLLKVIKEFKETC